MKNSENISVIIPAYNCERYISKCLDSIVCQAPSFFEIIIINDGSTDGTKDVCECYADKYSNIKLVNQDNQGVSKARNKGIEFAKGEWIAFIDADDFILPDFSKVMLDSIRNSEKDWVIGNYQLNKGNKKIDNNNFYCSEVNVYKTLMINILNEKNAGKLKSSQLFGLRNIWGKLYRKSIIDKNNIKFDSQIKYFEDGIFNMEYLNSIKQEKILLVNKVVYSYRVDSEQSATKKLRANILNEDYKKIQIVSEFIKNNNDKDIEKAYHLFCFDLFSSFLVNFLFHKENKESIICKYKTLKSVAKEDRYNIKKYTFQIKKYIKKDKRMILFVIEKKLYFLATILLYIRAFIV